MPPRRHAQLTPSVMMMIVISMLLLPSTTGPTTALAFMVQPYRFSFPRNPARRNIGDLPALALTGDSFVRRTSTTASSSTLHMTAVVSVVKSVAAPLSKPLAKKMLLILGAAILALFSKNQYKSILWPGSSPDSTLTEPLPPGSFGCPLFGNNIIAGTREYGPYAFFSKATKRWNNPTLMKLYAFGTPIVSVRGANNIQTILKDEFDDDGVHTELVGSYSQLFGNESVLYESNGKTHSLLRRLVGSSMMPPAVTNAVSAIQQAANVQIDDMLTQDTVKMEDVCNDFTLDVAWRQILGLNLDDDEIEVFYQNVKEWIGGMFNPLLALPFTVPGLRFTKAFKAHEYLVNKVEEKLAKLEASGPDGSTLSGIYFATDDGDADGSRKLSRQQVIDNALILILAGSETSASTLTTASLLLGLHKNVWYKLKEEQADMIAKCGNDISSKAEIDTECPYLDSVIRETLRLKPIPATEIRRTMKSIVLDGMQIPKNWMLWLNIRSTHDNDPVTMEPDGSHMDVKLGFKPERWSDPETKPSQWLPFGSGARRCLGENLAMTEMKVFLAMLARRVDYDLLSPSDEILWKRMSAMPRPLDGVVVAPRPVEITSTLVENLYDIE